MCYYDARLGISVYGGLFNPLTLRPFCTYYTFQAFGYLYALGSRAAVSGQEVPVCALAACDGAGEKKAVLLANLGEKTRIQTDLPTGFKAYLIDFDYPMTQTDLDTADIEIEKFRTILFKNE